MYAVAARNPLITQRAELLQGVGLDLQTIDITELALRPPLSTPFRAAVAFYPNCRGNAATINVPTLILIGALDDWTPEAPCAAWGSRVGDTNKLDVIVYPGAHHKFDGVGVGNTFGQGGVPHHLQYNWAAAEDANTRADAFLARWLKQ